MKHVTTKVATTLGALMMCGFNFGCATNGPTKAARLTATDAQTMTKIRAALATATGRPRFELGPEELATTTSISVLPVLLGPLETRSLAVPLVFDIVLQNRACALVARADGKTYPLKGVRCTAIEPR